MRPKIEKMKVDFLIIGQGLAGSALALELLRRDQSVLVVDRRDKGSSSRVAAGLITPLTGKGMNPAWRQDEYLKKAVTFYHTLEKESGRKIYHKTPVIRLFGTEKERKKWEAKGCEHDQWAYDAGRIKGPFVSDHGGLDMPDGAWLDTVVFLQVIQDRLVDAGAWREGDFSEDDVVFENDGLRWQDVIAGKIILCQGAYGLSGVSGGKKDDAWFRYLPHRSAKGEILSLWVDGLDDTKRYHGNGWLAPRVGGMWKAGANYDWENLNSIPTEKGKEEVLTKLRTWLKEDDVPMEVIEHEAGVRPIIRNSRPVVGFHPEMPDVGFFNGLGSKGSLMAPAVAEHFAQHLCGECDLDAELSLEGFQFRPPNTQASMQLGSHMTHEVVKGSLITKAHDLLKNVIQSGDVVVDATLGNGHDTLFLAQCVGVTGKVIGFDIQQEALVATRERLSEAAVKLDVAELHLKSHAELSALVPQDVSAVMFNLGYLPGGDKTKITHWKSTEVALRSALSCLKKHGLLTVMCYPGHPGGDKEARMVKCLFEAFQKKSFSVKCFQREGARDTTPFLLVAERL